MFYVAELNLKGKGPLGSMWQACWAPNKISKKVIEAFEIENGVEAILKPDGDMLFALRLNGNLLLGISRLHGMKVNLLDDNIKNASDRLKYKFTVNTSAVDLDISKASRGKTESKRSEELQMSIAEHDMILDIPDEVPSWLQSEEWELSQVRAEGFPAVSPGGISAITAMSRNRSSIINLPDASRDGSGFGTDQDERMYSDMLEVPGEMPEELAAYEALDFGASATASRDASSMGRSADDYDVMHDDGMAQHDMGDYDLGDDGSSAGRSGKRGAAERPAKRPRKSGKLDTATQIPKNEYRKWVTDPEWVKTHLSKPRRPLGSAKEVPIAVRVSMPLSGGFGRRLTKLFTETLAFSEKTTPKKKGKRPSSAKKGEADADMREEDVFDNPPDYGDAFAGYDGYDGGDVAYGVDSSDAGGSSIAREDPERMRAGSEERRASRESQGLNADARSSADRMSLPSFENQTPQGSVMSGSIASSRGRMASIGEFYDPTDMQNDPLMQYDEIDDASKKQDLFLKEEPESLQATYSQLPASQRLSDHSVLVARQIAIKLPNDDDELTFQYLTRNLNNRNAARCFYSMLLLVNENVVKAEQEEAYGDIVMTATENTAMYAS
mmetsp:Transcript_52178/g.129984  ORF Transcript_52178/g.129984 Transcript_52178/m.129984 type:complete len:611 (+) Transcript_52178:83-1915(+)